MLSKAYHRTKVLQSYGKTPDSCSGSPALARTLTISRTEILRIHRGVQHTIAQPAVISVKKHEIQVNKHHLYTFL